VPLFEGASDVLDIGCGRGEFLDLLQERGVGARGVDINLEMVEECRSRGLEATAGDAVEYLRGLEDESLGGLFAAQVVEHLEPAYLIRFLEVASRKLRPGSTVVLETINPSCWFAFFDGYIRDITHVRPLHPDTLKYLLAAAGFQRTSVRYSAPYPEHAKLQHVAAPGGGNGAAAPGRLSGAIDVLNENADKLNTLLFTHMDYAAIGER
jgi:O-antigen chain-terminating methyltransferase